MEKVVGVVVVFVEDVAGKTLEPNPQWLEGEGDDEGHDGGDEEVAVGGGFLEKEEAGAEQPDGVDDTEGEGEEKVGDRAGDNETDVKEAVAEDGVGDEAGEEEAGEGA